MLQQYLPFTVLKHQSIILSGTDFNVATVLTVYGIETTYSVTVIAITVSLQQYLPFTVLKLIY